MIVGHPQRAADPVETQFAVGPLEAQWMRHLDFATGLDVEPLVHAPEMPAADVELERVDDARDERKVLGGANRAADADRAVVGALPPRLDVLERFGEIELFERIVEHHAKARPRQSQEIAGFEPRRLVDNRAVERGVVPPVWRDRAEPTRHVRAPVRSGD